MDIFRRILLIVWGLLLVCFSAVTAVFLLKTPLAERFFQRISEIFLSGYYIWLLLGCAVLMLALGILALFSAFQRQTVRQLMQIESAEGTMINVSLSAIENVVRRAAAEVVGIREVRCQLKIADTGLGISLFLSIPQGVAVPATATAAKAMVEEQLFSMTGIKPVELQVIVDNIVDK